MEEGVTVTTPNLDTSLCKAVTVEREGEIMLLFED